MSRYCNTCDRWFSGDRSIEQHFLDSPRHNYCCGRHFPNQHALNQHMNAHSDSDSEYYSSDASEYYSSESESDQSDDDDGFNCSKCNDRYFVNWNAYSQHLMKSSNHNYCVTCHRDFINPNALRMHLTSAVHRGKNVPCLICKANFVSASALAQHYECGGCKVKITRQQIRQAVDNWESKNNIQGYITRPMIEWHDSSNGSSEFIATERSFNGSGYECYFCHREFGKLTSLNSHLKSPAHESKNYKCPKCKAGFRVISSLVQHFESESCGFVRFNTVNQIANDITAQMSRLLM